MQHRPKPDFAELSRDFRHWEKIGDLMDQCIDLMLNLRQSGHPGGSRSKVPMLVAATLGAGMRWDIRHPEKRFGDRFVLVGGHTIPLIYCTLAVLNEALRVKHAQTGDPRYLVPPLLYQMRDAGWDGFKTGRGFYDWSDRKNPKAIPYEDLTKPKG